MLKKLIAEFWTDFWSHAAGMCGINELATRRGLINLKKNEKERVDRDAAWIEISLYGFISNVYMRYVRGSLSACKVLSLPDGSRVLKFEDGSLILEGNTGHLVELDKRRRVVLVRVRKSEAEGARLALGHVDLSSAFTISKNKEGQSVMVLPGSITVFEDSNQVRINMPNGIEVFAKKLVA